MRLGRVERPCQVPGHPEHHPTHLDTSPVKAEESQISVYKIRTKNKLPFPEQGLITGSGVHGEGPPNHLEC